MATKSVIEIDVLDEKFQAFAAAFEKYQNALKSMPADWQKVNETANRGAQNLNKELVKANKNQKDLNKSATDSNVAFRNAARTTGQIASNLASAAVSVAKWLTFGAIGGGFGLGGLASSASDYRRQAQGLGVSTGQLRSANVNLGRYINPEATLGNIAEIQSDLSRRQILGRLGGQAEQNPAEMLPQLIKSAIEQFKTGGKTQQYAEAMGLTQIFSMEELRRLSSLTEKELSETIAQYQKSRKALEVDDAASKAWQDFWVQLKLAGNTIEVSFIKNLEKITPQLIKLSETVTNAITSLLSSKEFESAVKDFANYLNSAEFKDDVKSFFSALKNLAEFINSTFGFVKNRKEDLRQLGERVFGTSTDIAAREAKTPEELQMQTAQYFMGKGLSKVQAIGLTANLQAESGLNTAAVGDSGKAYGIAQWHPDRQAEFQKQFGHSIKTSTFKEQLDFIIYELNNRESAAREQLLKATTIPEAVKAGVAYERPKDTAGETARRINIANKIEVNVTTTAGSDITASAKGLPQ